jgi:hypothetical protein
LVWVEVTFEVEQPITVSAAAKPVVNILFIIANVN